MKILKKISLLSLLSMLILLSASDFIKAQKISTGVDLYSTYVFRGVAYSGPAIQPSVEFSSKGFSLGAWGSQGIDGIGGASNGFQEMDLYASYSFDFGLSLGITDYYYPGTPYFSYTEDAANGDFSSHAFEINSSYEIENFSLAANLILNEASGAGSSGGDLYFEAGYSLEKTNLFLGVGDGWHSSTSDLALVNLGLTTSKDLVITDTFSIPFSASVILNPDSEQLFILVGVSF